MDDLYEILEVSPRASEEVIAAAYRRLSRKYHPDVAADPSASERQKALNLAFEILGDPARRREYDEAWTKQRPTGNRTAPKEDAGTSPTSQSHPEKRTLPSSFVLIGALTLLLLIAIGTAAYIGETSRDDAAASPNASPGAPSSAKSAPSIPTPVQTTAPSATATAPTTAAAVQFTSIHDYCSVNRETDWPPSAESPRIDGINTPTGPNDAPLVWRCAEGTAVVCDPGATGGACMRISFSTEPSSALRGFCAANPNSFPPNAVVGHNSAYQWRCTNGFARVEDELISAGAVDKRGYLLERWTFIQAPSTVFQFPQAPIPPAGNRNATAQTPDGALRNWVAVYFTSEAYAGECARATVTNDRGKLCGVLTETTGRLATGWIARTFSDSNGWRAQLAADENGRWVVLNIEPELPVPHPTGWPPAPDAAVTGALARPPSKGDRARVSHTGGTCVNVRGEDLAPTGTCLAEGTMVTITGGPYLLGGYEWFATGPSSFIAGRYLVPVAQ
ncbi:MAG: J domain-containing protein [Dehalococcoidia bacterium]|nr:J domain-containing protein [Dehalococcoidia bacterium]